jgi:hypothetical protein
VVARTANSRHYFPVPDSASRHTVRDTTVASEAKATPARKDDGGDARCIAPVGRWLLSALPQLTLPWWMDAFPQTLSHFSKDIAVVLTDMFADVARTDRVIATEPGNATLADGERLVWRLGDSVYADTFGRFKFEAPNAPLPSEAAALAALTGTVTEQARALDEASRASLFTALDRDKRADLRRVDAVFLPAANEAASDAAAAPAQPRACFNKGRYGVLACCRNWGA